MSPGLEIKFKFKFKFKAKGGSRREENEGVKGENFKGYVIMA